jgi:hypothetical protein
MHATNYLRDIRDIYTDNRRIAKLHAAYPNMAAAVYTSLKLTEEAPKFILPDGGRILNDNLRGITDLPKLPFPVIVVEFPVSLDKINVREGQTAFSKLCVIASQLEEKITVFSFVYVEFGDGKAVKWIPNNYIAIITPASPDIKPVNPGGKRIADNIVVELRSLGEKVFDHKEAMDEMYTEIRAVLELIEALSCSNVGTTALPVQKLNKSAARRGALPFDEYRVLTIIPNENKNSAKHIGVENNRHPREHLRRGHIRICHSGLKIWVQSCIVNAGVGGKITHDYKVKHA